MAAGDDLISMDDEITAPRSTRVTIGPQLPTIDLTDDSPLPLLITASDEDADLAKALAMSVESSGLALNRFGAQDEDAEYTKAMEASLASLHEEVGNGRDVGSLFGRAEDRVRDDMSSPPILRSLSPHLSGLSAYLQCIYAVPSWRNEVLAYRPVEADLGGKRSFDGYWKGESSQYSNSGSDVPLGQMWELQRLFAIMSETRRAFVHVSDVERQLDVNDQAYKFSGFWVEELKLLHTTLVDAFTTCDSLRLAYLETNNLLPEGDGHRIETQRQQSVFHVCGRTILDNEYVSAPLPFHEPEEGDIATVFELDLDPLQAPPATFFSALDSLLASDPSSPSLSLFTNEPATLAFKIKRAVRSVSSLDGFGKGTMRRKEVFRLPPEVWLDRYSIKKRGAISAGRAKIKELEQEREVKIAARTKLAVTADGGDAVQLARNLIEYLKIATTEEPTRAERQKRLSDQYPIVLSKMEEKIAEYDAAITALDREIEQVFDCPEMRKCGPYELRSILMWNGLNGRGSAWSVVKDDMGKWWRIRDLVKEEIALEEALSDTSGVHLDAGSCMAFYQNTSLVPARAEVPSFLRQAVLADNHTFATELPIGVSASWNLPLLEFLDLTPHHLPETVSFLGTDDAATEEWVQDFVLPSPAASDIVVDVDLPRETRVPREDSPVDPAAVLRIRGGAADEEEEEEEEEEGECDSEGEDEDEVELGCVKAMSATWDVDLSVGKIGGTPRWIDPESPLSYDDITCRTCQSIMAFLLQMNSPDDDRPYAASRALYIYVCRTKDCSGRRVWRVQMSSPNKFYPHTPEAEALRKQIESSLDPKTALIGPAPTDSKVSAIFPEWEIVCEPEPYEESYLPEPVQAGIEGDMGPDDEAEPDTVSGVDGAFLRFQERVQRMPEQVLRFYRLPGVDAPAPLWVSDKQIQSSEIAKCSLCSSPKDVEFQVLSTLLTYLEDYELSLDSLLIYTCLENCEIPLGSEGRTGWMEETAVGLVYTEAGVTFGRE